MRAREGRLLSEKEGVAFFECFYVFWAAWTKIGALLPPSGHGYDLLVGGKPVVVALDLVHNQIRRGCSDIFWQWIHTGCVRKLRGCVDVGEAKIPGYPFSNSLTPLLYILPVKSQHGVNLMMLEPLDKGFLRPFMGNQRRGRGRQISPDYFHEALIGCKNWKACAGGV